MKGCTISVDRMYVILCTIFSTESSIIYITQKNRYDYKLLLHNFLIGFFLTVNLISVAFISLSEVFPLGNDIDSLNYS